MNKSSKTFNEIRGLVREGMAFGLKGNTEGQAKAEELLGAAVARLVPELKEEVVDAAFAAQEFATPGLEEEPAPKAKVAAPKAKPAKRAKRGGEKRSPKELELACKQFLAAVKKTPGQRMEQLREGLGGETKDWVLPARKLLGDKAIKTKGQKRATTYYPR